MAAQELSEAEATPVWVVVGTDDDEGALYGVFASPELAQEHADEFDDGTVIVQREPVIGSEAAGVTVPTNNEDREALIAIRDAYDRAMDVRPVCDDDFYAAVQEALNRVCDSDGNFIARRLPGDNAELIEEALDESTFGPGSDYDSACYWANLARKLARALSASQPREAAPSDTDREALIEVATWALIDNDTDVADRGVRDEHYRERRADVERVLPILSRTSHPVQVEVTDEMRAVVDELNAEISTEVGEARAEERQPSPITAVLGRARDALMAALGGGEL